MDKENLKTNKTDIITSSLASSISLVPVIGGSLSEIIHCVIPNQREERIINFVEDISDRLEKMEYSIEKITELFSNHKYGTFTYNCIRSVVNDIYDEKIEYYKNICVNALTNDEKNLLHCERILKILSELDYYEILYLEFYYSVTILGNDKIQEIREKLGYNDLTPSYLFYMDEEEFDQETYKQITLNNLCNSGLLLRESKISKAGKIRYSYKITQLGKLILKKIGVINNE